MLLLATKTIREPTMQHCLEEGTLSSSIVPLQTYKYTFYIMVKLCL